MRLSKADKQKVLNLTLQAAILSLHHAPNVHYTQGVLRWEGIDKGLKAYRGQYPHHADCSSSATWWLWNGFSHLGLPDTVNGQHWRAGYTGTLLQHGERVLWPKPGDLVIYGSKWPGEHVALFTGGGLVVSHGSEAGPFLLPWKYRNDVLSMRRYF